MGTLFYLFCTSLIIQIVGFGLFPLLPGYAMRFGADTAAAGLYLGAVYVAISLGSMLPGWLPARVSRKQAFLAGALIGLPALFLLGHATELWQVVLLTSALWFSGGVGLALGGLYTGLLSAAGRRGRIFTLVSLSMPVASLTGGLLVGWLVQTQGYSFTFTALGVMWIALPLIVYFKLDDPQPAAEQPAAEQPAAERPAAEMRGDPRDGLRPAGAATAAPRRASGAYALLLAAGLLVAATIGLGRLGSSVAMAALAYSPAAISSTSTVAGAVLIPFMLLSGALSDRLGTRRFLIGGYLLAGAGALVLIAASELWHFWLAMTLLLVGRAAGDSLSLAVATELLPKDELGRALPSLKATGWIGGVASFAGGGYALALLGQAPAFAIAGGIAVLAGALLAVGGFQRQKPRMNADERGWPIAQWLVPTRRRPRPTA
jgi:MFS family permease